MPLEKQVLAKYRCLHKTDAYTDADACRETDAYTDTDAGRETHCTAYIPVSLRMDDVCLIP